MNIGQGIRTLTIFCATFLALFLLQYNPLGFGDPDGYYHVKIAKLLGQGTILHSFPWLTQTSWESVFADQHFLYHFLLMPFTKIHDFVGPQMLNALLVTLALYLVYYLLRTQNVRYPIFLTLLILTSQQFLGRMLLVKAVPLGIIGLLLISILIIKHKPFLVGIVSALLVLAYGGFVFIPVLLTCYVVARLLAKKTVDLRIIIATFGGVLIGVLLHPNAPELPYHLYNQIFEAGLGYSVPVGNEWLSPNPTQFIIGNILVLIAWLLGLAAWLATPDKKTEFRILFLQLTAISFLLLTLKSSRFIEYFAPLAILATGISLSPRLLRLPDLKSMFKGSIRQIQFAPIFLGTIALLSAVLLGALRISESIKYNRDVTGYLGVAQFLKQTTTDDDIIFNTRWDQFPILFYLNDENRYIVGMDPSFMYHRSPETYWLWYHISQDEGTICDKKVCLEGMVTADALPELMQTTFQTKHLFVSKSSNPNLAKTLAVHTKYYKSYEDGAFAVFKLKD